jgi:group I intron endonuclease
MKKYKYIYRTINLINGKSYIGQHVTNKEYDNYIGSGRYFIKAVKKFGKNNFIRGIIEYCETQDELNKREIFWINHYDTISPNGYNLSIGGGVVILYGKENPFFGKHHSEETKKKLSEQKKGNIPHNKGKKGLQKCSEKTKKIVSERHKGDKNFNYNKKGILSPSFGLKRSESTKNKLRETKIGANNPNKGIYEIYAPDGKYFYVDYGASEFIRKHPEYNLGIYFIYDATKANREYKGWKIKKLN